MLGENSTVWGDPFYGLSAQIKLLCLFSSKQTFLNLRCSGSVRWFRSPVTCTHGFAHALCFFKVKTINNLLAKCFLCCTKTCLSEFLPSSEDFGFYSTWAELLLCMIRSSWVLFFLLLFFPFLFPLEMIYLKELNTLSVSERNVSFQTYLDCCYSHLLLYNWRLKLIKP